MAGDLSTRAAVVGGGPVGLATALLLAKLGLDVITIFPEDGPSSDRRTAALFGGSIELLRNLGVLDRCLEVSAPILGIRIVDDTGALLRAPETLFTADELGLGVFGYNVPNAVLTAALTEAAVAQANLTLVRANATAITPGEKVVTLQAGATQVAAEIVVGADGRRSLARVAAGIETQAWQYPQTAIVTSFAHRRPHRGISTEFHRGAGPLTTVPMQGNRSSLVWVERHKEAEQLAGLNDEDFRAALEQRLNGLLGSIETPAPRGMFPLSGLTANTLAANRVALVGEAAHVMPPIGAQGLNLGLRDAAVLAETLANSGLDVGSQANLARYAASRSPDVLSRVTAIDALNRSLLSGFLPAHVVRGFGLFALGALPALKRMVVREGLQPTLATPLAMQPGGMARLQAQSSGQAFRAAGGA